MIHVYPGMGATSAMYSAPWRKLPHTVFHDWPKGATETTIAELAAHLISLHEIEEGDTIIGSSLGGIVACEISNQLRLKKLVLIGSAINKDEISSLLNTLHPLIDLTPIGFIQFSAGKLPIEIASMFSKSDPDFIRNMSKAIFNWEGLKSDVTLKRIHGKHDHVIPIPEGIRNPINGGHLIAMTHPEECIAEIDLDLD